MSRNSFETLTTLQVSTRSFQIYSLAKLAARYPVERLPFCLKIMLENLLRNEDGVDVTAQDIERFFDVTAGGQPEAHQIAFTPARVVLQDFTGVPSVVDLAAMRDAIVKLGGDAERINPQVAVDLVIDHSVTVDHFASPEAMQKNIAAEFERNRERYAFLRWGQQAFTNFRVVPPGTGIVHQVNLEFLAQVVMTAAGDGGTLAYPDTLVGTDSHTTMINGLGVLGWGVGGIEAEAGMLGQPISMLRPEVVGCELQGALPVGVTATDLVLTVTEMLRAHGVVGKFVEFFGDGLRHLSLADRATVANMAPEYGATVGIFPIDDKTLSYLALTGRSSEQVALVEAYAKAQGLWRAVDRDEKEVAYAERLHLDLQSVVPSLAGPKRPQDRVALGDAKRSFAVFLDQTLDRDGLPQAAAETGVEVADGGAGYRLKHGDVVIAAITSCTNTSNPAVMLAAGLVAKKAHARGLTVKPWVKTSLAPGSQVVPAYLQKAGLSEALDALGFQLVGFGCTTCIGNSGPLSPAISQAIKKGELTVAAVLSGNRNFEGRIHAEVKANYLASPPLVVAYALAGTMNLDLLTEPLGSDHDGNAVFLADLWPSPAEIDELLETCLDREMYRERYADVFHGPDQWRALPEGAAQTYSWPESTYVKQPPFFEGLTMVPTKPRRIVGARCLIKVGDSITTDHISPAGAIAADTPAGIYLLEHGVSPQDFNSLGSRRGNHEVMMRGTFANVHLRNQLAPGAVGGFSCYLPDNGVMSVYDAALKYQQTETPLVVLAGKEYGTGSSRDWAAKGAKLLGIEAVIAESFERIHRSNLVGFGVLPLQYTAGQTAEALGLTGTEEFTFNKAVAPGTGLLTVTVGRDDGTELEFDVAVRIDTPSEWNYFENGGILQTVLRKLALAGGVQHDG